MKLSLILSFALAAYTLMHRRSAALRHWVLAAGLVCGAIVPGLELVIPSWRVPFGTPAAFEPYDPASPGVPAPGANTSVFGPSSSRRPVGPTGFEKIHPGDALKWMALAGTVGAGLVLLSGLLRLAWLSRHARRLRSGRWVELAEEISRAYDLRRPVLLLQSDHPALLATWGILHPRILLPAAAELWSEERARAVLTHELAHASRGDWLFQLFAELVRAVYWINPLLWIVCNRLRLESERACDDEVLNRGLYGPDYAAHLVEVARSLTTARRLWLPAPAMARASHLERRVRAMLNEHVNRTPINPTARRAIFAGLLVLSAVVAAAQGTFVSLIGSVSDEQTRGISGATVTLTNDPRQSRYEVKTNENGRFEFVGLPPGNYGFEVRGNGFKTFKDTMAVGSQNLQRNVKLELGTLQETITLTFTHQSWGDTPRITEVAMPKKTECVPATEGGRIVPPRKIRDVYPVYPDSLRATTGAEGTVVMEAKIGVDGYVGDIRITGNAHPDLEQAAVAAVREWRYTETLLNCQPVEVVMTVTVNFRRAPPPAPGRGPA